MLGNESGIYKYSLRPTQIDTGIKDEIGRVVSNFLTIFCFINAVFVLPLLPIDRNYIPHFDFRKIVKRVLTPECVGPG